MGQKQANNKPNVQLSVQPETTCRPLARQKMEIGKVQKRQVVAVAF